jgi:hypothetical protein
VSNRWIDHLVDIFEKLLLAALLKHGGDVEELPFRRTVGIVTSVTMVRPQSL